ncbi:hypothetical protein EMPG_17554 [Blastomyces silverae]|uniref:Uncharacterized protein n=1 Tax=Blastomyces silverae TaxID=2060906 RepID=A0A0H1BCK1_9EURO|nr:hypothetical protein EMPG_17554 [Blastomyces silverae]
MWHLVLEHKRANEAILRGQTAMESVNTEVLRLFGLNAQEPAVVAVAEAKQPKTPGRLQAR